MRNERTADAKERALASLGLGPPGRRRRREQWMWAITDVIAVDAGRCVLRRGEFLRSIIVATHGTFWLEGLETSAVAHSEMVLDTWCCDDRFASTVEATALEAASLIVVTIEHRDAFLHQLPLLRRRAAATATLLTAPIEGTTIGTESRLAATHAADLHAGEGSRP